jgi:hypothetical protein
MAVRISVAGLAEGAVYWLTGDGDRLVVDGSDAFALEAAAVAGAPRAGGNVANFEATTRLSAGGSFSFSLPANCTEAGYLDVLQRIDCYWDHRLIMSGYIKEIAVEGDMLTVTGDDMAHELAATVVSAATTGLIAASDAVDWIGTELPAGWTLDNDVTGTQEVYLSAVVRESLLATLGAICTAAGLWFVIDGQTLRVADAYGAVVHGVKIGRLSKRSDSNEIANKVYPYGAGGKDVAIDLRASDATASGYTINKTENSITFTGSAYPLREREMQFPKVTPQAATEAALIEASNALVLESVRYLQRHATPLTSYGAEVHYGRRLLPLERVAVAVRTPGLLVNETPVITESRLQIGPTGAKQALTLETDARRIPTDAQVVASAIVTANNAVLYPTPKSVSATPNFSQRVTASNQEYALLWDLGGRAFQLLSAQLTGSLTGTGASPISAGTLQYRRNGTGTWTTLSSAVDLLSVMAEADTGFPIAQSGTINLRTVGQSEYVPELGGDAISSVPNGTTILFLGAVNRYAEASLTTIAGSYVAGDSATILSTSHNGSAQVLLLDTFPSDTYVKFWTFLSGSGITWAIPATTSRVEADLTAQLAIQAIAI